MFRELFLRKEELNDILKRASKPRYSIKEQANELWVVSNEPVTSVHNSGCSETQFNVWCCLPWYEQYLNGDAENEADDQFHFHSQLAIKSCLKKNPAENSITGIEIRNSILTLFVSLVQFVSDRKVVNFNKRT